MNWKNLVSLLVAIVMGLAALWIGRNIILGKQMAVKPEGDFVSVVVANRDLGATEIKVTEGLFTFVALDDENRPRPVDQLA